MENFKFLDGVKKYFVKHQELIYTLAIIILIDHFLFDGALRDKIKNTVEKLLDKANLGVDKID